jgi:hypothetical protein
MNVQSWFADGAIGYEWSKQLNKTERLAARKELADKSPNKKPIILRGKE